MEKELRGFLGSQSAGHEDDEIIFVQSEDAAGDRRGQQELIDVDAVMDDGDT